MANRALHDVGGIAAGAFAAVVMAGEQPNAHIFLECVGGCIAGLAASRLPDMFDPPVSPNHRNVAHAVAPVGAVLVAAWDLLKEGQEALRAYADSLVVERERSNSMTDSQRLLNQLLEWLCRALAGTLAGAAGGYLSHLVLDGCSPRGLPVLARGM